MDQRKVNELALMLKLPLHTLTRSITDVSLSLFCIGLYVDEADANIGGTLKMCGHHFLLLSVIYLVGCHRWITGVTYCPNGSCLPITSSLAGYIVFLLAEVSFVVEMNTDPIVAFDRLVLFSVKFRRIGECRNVIPSGSPMWDGQLWLEYEVGGPLLPTLSDCFNPLSFFMMDFLFVFYFWSLGWLLCHVCGLLTVFYRPVVCLSSRLRTGPCRSASSKNETPDCTNANCRLIRRAASLSNSSSLVSTEYCILILLAMRPFGYQ